MMAKVARTGDTGFVMDITEIRFTTIVAERNNEISMRGVKKTH